MLSFCASRLTAITAPTPIPGPLILTLTRGLLGFVCRGTVVLGKGPLRGDIQHRGVLRAMHPVGLVAYYLKLPTSGTKQNLHPKHDFEFEEERLFALCTRPPEIFLRATSYSSHLKKKMQEFVENIVVYTNRW